MELTIIDVQAYIANAIRQEVAETEKAANGNGEYKWDGQLWFSEKPGSAAQVLSTS